MPYGQRSLMTVDQHDLILSALPQYLSYQNLTSEKLVALSFDLFGPTQTRLSLAYVQDASLPFSGLIRPRYTYELASWIPFKGSVFFETAEPIPDGHAPTLCALRDQFLQFRSWDGSSKVSLFCASRFFKRHSQYLITRTHDVYCLYRPGSTGISGIRLLPAFGLLIGFRMNAQSQAEALMKIEANLAFNRMDHRLGQASLWKEWTSLSSHQSAPFLSRMFGNDKHPDAMLNLGSDDRTHLSFRAQNRISIPHTFQMKERVIGSSRIPNTETCLIYHASSSAIEVENVVVTGNGPYANDLGSTTL